MKRPAVGPLGRSSPFFEVTPSLPIPIPFATGERWDSFFWWRTHRFPKRLAFL